MSNREWLVGVGLRVGVALKTPGLRHQVSVELLAPSGEWSGSTSGLKWKWKPRSADGLAALPVSEKKDNLLGRQWTTRPCIIAINQAPRADVAFKSYSFELFHLNWVSVSGWSCQRHTVRDPYENDHEDWSDGKNQDVDRVNNANSRHITAWKAQN